MKYRILTYGCQMNRSDSERIAAILEKKGYLPAPKTSGADLVVVNMCSIRQSAVDRIYGLEPKLRKLKTKKILTGCILNKDRARFRKTFDEIWDNKDFFKSPPQNKSRIRALIPISNGCNNRCTYCVVPFTRGPLVCRDHREIIREAGRAAKNGAREMWLLGQNVNDYASPADPRVGFARLLELIDAIPGDFWFRFTSPHPKYFSKELIQTLSQCRKFARYLNLPVQSGDDEILKRMTRPYRAGQYKKLVKEIRRKIPALALSTDVIVGFPGETERQFKNTAKLMNEIKFDMAYIARYSKRPQTEAAKMEDDVPDKEKERRERILTEILKKTALAENKKLVGKTLKVLAEKRKGRFAIGKSEQNKTVKFESERDLTGEFAAVRITEAFPWGLKGELAEK